MNRTISTTEPNLIAKNHPSSATIISHHGPFQGIVEGLGEAHVISHKTPYTCGSFLDNSCPTNPTKLAQGTMAMYAKVKIKT
jgi:hypothetical protein